MDITNTQDTRTAQKKTVPLWKQLVGALGGAAVAFMLYQGYTFTAPRLQALVTLPSAPGIGDQATTRMATDEHVEKQSRIARRIREIASRFGRANTDSVEITRSAVTVEEVSPPTSDPAPTQGETFTGPVWPIGTVSEPNVWNAGTTQSSSASSVASSTATNPFNDQNRVMYGPYGWLKNAKKYGLVSSFSSVPAVAQVAAPVMGVTAETPSSVVPVAPAAVDAPVTEEAPVSDEAAMVDEAAMHDSASDESTLPDPYELPAPLMAEVSNRGNSLPQSGFGIGLLSLTALGAALGRRATRRRV